MISQLSKSLLISAKTILVGIVCSTALTVVLLFLVVVGIDYFLEPTPPAPPQLGGGLEHFGLFLIAMMTLPALSSWVAGFMAGRYLCRQQPQADYIVLQSLLCGFVIGLFVPYVLYDLLSPRAPESVVSDLKSIAFFGGPASFLTLLGCKYRDFGTM